jgi:hypothetical protein
MRSGGFRGGSAQRRQDDFEVGRMFPALCCQVGSKVEQCSSWVTNTITLPKANVRNKNDIGNVPLLPNSSMAHMRSGGRLFRKPQPPEAWG